MADQVPTSSYTGVRWNGKAKRWYGYSYNPLTKKLEATSGFPRDKDEECVAAYQALRARQDAECAAAGKTRKEKGVAAKKSALKGVTWNKATEKWEGMAQNPRGGKVYVGLFVDEHEAKRAVDAERAKLVAAYDAEMGALAAANRVTAGLPRAPALAKDAEKNKAYWHVHGKTTPPHTPYRVVRSGDQYLQACQKGQCTTIACAPGKGGAAKFCDAHGGGRRCGVDGCTSYRDDGIMPFAPFTLNTDTAFAPKGTFVCANCNARLHTGKGKANACVTKEQLVAIANELEFPQLQSEAVDGVVCDATLGTGRSKRRSDLGWRLVDERFVVDEDPRSGQYVVVNETDEFPHLGGRGCYALDGVSAKFSGQMVDMGAPGISERDSNWLDAHSGDLSNEERLGTAESHLTRKMDKIFKKIEDAPPKMIPFRAVSFSVDSYVDCHGVRHPSAFKEYSTNSGEKRVRTNEPEFAKRYACNARELRKMMEMGASGPSFAHTFLFYNGSDPVTGLGGTPPSGESASQGGDEQANARLDAVVAVAKKRKASKAEGKRKAPVAGPSTAAPPPPKAAKLPSCFESDSE